ncbi:MAG: flagellin lysine-N-methylase [Clostridia bacterium]|nr:flagellin lysine-N-methylase [Clostridia bacterium]
MKLFAPKYYRQFSCIADRCSHSCCIGWEIDIDRRTKKKYSSLTGDYAEAIRKSILSKPTPHFLLDNEERCPHLNKDGLCNIIINFGEDALCDICREHPRFYNYTSLGKEVGLGMACEEASRLILSWEDYETLEQIGDVQDSSCVSNGLGVSCRNEVFNILALPVSYTERLRMIYEKFNIRPDSVSDKRWQMAIDELEYLNPSHKELFLNYSSVLNDTPLDIFLERALSYYVYRHCSEALDTDELLRSLSFCLFCERLFASVANHLNAKDLDELVQIGVIISEELEYSEDNTEKLKLVQNR